MRSLWMRIREPRVQRVVYMIVYATLSFAGLAVLNQPPTSIEGQIGQGLTHAWGFFLACTGVAAVAVLPGWWWLEKIGGMAGTTGLAIYACVTLYLNAAEPAGSRLPQALVVVGAGLLLGIRAWEIRELDYEPRGV